MAQKKKSVPIVYEGESPLIQPIDLDGFREWNRKKTKKLVDKRMTEEEAIENIDSSMTAIISASNSMERSDAPSL